MRRRHRPKSTVHDRELKPLGRNPAGPKSARPGYPALFLGHAAATKTLVEIACRQPVPVEDLPERELVSAANLGYTVRRLVAIGLVRRYRRAEHEQRLVLTLDERHPFAPAARTLLRSVARSNGLRWAPSPSPPETLAVREGPNVTGLQILGHDRHPTRVLFGSPNRTAAVLLVASMNEVDRTTIGTVCGIDLKADILRLFDPIEADGIFRSRMVGGIRLFSLAPGPWVKPLRELAAMAIAQDGLLAGRLNAAKILVANGDFSNRKHLRARLGLPDPNGPDSGSAE